MKGPAKILSTRNLFWPVKRLDLLPVRAKPPTNDAGKEYGVNQLACFKRDLESERSLKVQSVNNASNPVERELLERELILIDAQILWLDEVLTDKTAA